MDELGLTRLQKQMLIIRDRVGIQPRSTRMITKAMTHLGKRPDILVFRPCWPWLRTVMSLVALHSALTCFYCFQGFC